MDVTQTRGHALGQFVKFGLVGGSGFVVNLIVYAAAIAAHGGPLHADDEITVILSSPFHVRWYHVASTIAFLVANLANYQLNRMWTFRDSHRRSWWSNYWPFLIIGVLAQVATLGILTTLNHPHSPLLLPDPPFSAGDGPFSRKYWSQAIAVVLTMPVNFLLNKTLNFAAPRRH